MIFIIGIMILIISYVVFVVRQLYNDTPKNRDTTSISELPNPFDRDNFGCLTVHTSVVYIL